METLRDLWQDLPLQPIHIKDQAQHAMVQADDMGTLTFSAAIECKDFWESKPWKSSEFLEVTRDTLVDRNVESPLLRMSCAPLDIMVEQTSWFDRAIRCLPKTFPPSLKTLVIHAVSKGPQEMAHSESEDDWHTPWHAVLRHFSELEHLAFLCNRSISNFNAFDLVDALSPTSRTLPCPQLHELVLFYDCDIKTLGDEERNDSRLNTLLTNLYETLTKRNGRKSRLKLLVLILRAQRDAGKSSVVEELPDRSLEEKLKSVVDQLEVKGRLHSYE
ncbi:hypothetical protein EVJ58_g10169 [Rhodofomes roseus]|nr:hypothetical protein EVJ58_g10169 [Rhodofomes roseus]